MRHRNRPIPRLAALTMAIAFAFLLPANEAQAGFLDDFWTSNGATSNITAPQMYNSAFGRSGTLGSVAYRAPVKSFVPFSVTAPHFTAGCGGIDFFLGSFSLANTTQFVNFLRAVGQNVAGLAFKVALTAMSPTLNAEMGKIADDINKWTSELKNSCKAATDLMASTGANSMITTAVTQAKQNLMDSGAATDAGATDQSVDSTPSQIVAGNTPVANSGGLIGDDINANIVWYAMQQANWTNVSDEEQRVIMSMLGTTTIIIRDPVSGNVVDPPTITPIPATITIDDLVGNIGVGSGASYVASVADNSLMDSTKIYQCDTTSGDCLTPTLPSGGPLPGPEALASRVYRVASTLRSSISNRTSINAMTNPSFTDLKAVFYGTSVPVLKAAIASGSPSAPGLSDDFLKALSYLAAYDMADNYIKTIMSLYQTQLSTLKGITGKTKYVNAIELLEGRINTQRAKLDALRVAHGAELLKFTSVQDEIDKMNQALRTTASMNFASNFNFR
jgi:conjugative transfer pilus assembly protein TraH